MQAVLARVYLKEDPRVVLFTLTGFKPVYDAYRIVCDVPQADGQAFDQDFTFAITRISETVVESIFQSFVQAIALAGAERRVGQVRGTNQRAQAERTEYLAPSHAAQQAGRGAPPRGSTHGRDYHR